jgi:glycine dehydrogenase subunit 1
MRSYISNTDADRQAMLQAMGKKSVDDLFAAIPQELQLKRTLDLPSAQSEMEAAQQVKSLANSNRSTDDLVCFLGAGAYDRYIPAVVDQLLIRQEFYTAYTPYQPEISQGTLQAVFEYQSMICALTGLDVSNASLYDGASALAEAMILSCKETGRKSVAVSRTVHPQGREVLRTYARFQGISVTEFGWKNGVVDMDGLKAALNADTACVIVQNPNFFGCVEDLEQMAQAAHANGSLLVTSCEPISLALLKSPGEAGADIAVGEGQGMGNLLSFGGPYLGFIAARQKLLRKMPGRIVGQTVDAEGTRGFVLTVQTREQHIRREKATSNICSNEALNALAATIYLSAMGKEGLVQAANLSLQKAKYAYDRLVETGKFKPLWNAPFFGEFALTYKGSTDKLNRQLLAHNILGGYELEESYPELKNGWLVAVTEKRTKEEIDAMVRWAVEA